ncbi:histone H4 transcription factor [Plodia interpunctella]|uniref:histone H4 transcription factor n=1 Tax=Plodia interpunctella TaxID=58824 RepID=UPI002368A546|nr:histone H4 transcription factor [Plodia interpunctella]XP_053612125.1 histone H4 transcription factor [Plodia interpunctella]
MEGKSEMEEKPKKPNVQKTKLARCVGWLQHQNSLESKNVQNQNDIEFIIRTNAERKKFLLSAVDDDATVPAGVEEPAVEPKAVPRLKLRVEKLRMECEWQACRDFFGNYERFQTHIRQHSSGLHVIGKEDSVEYVCLWDICGHKTSDFTEMVRHMNYHAYHARLMAIGFNGRATLKLDRCRKDSSKRNQLPPLNSPHTCLWFGCNESFDAIQALFDHVECAHIRYSEDFLCSWAGCGATFIKRNPLRVHMRSHTGERVIACYHCGLHFASYRKLTDHVRRQNVNPNTEFACSVCGKLHATEYLLRCHARQHISAYACAMCDMSAPTTAALAQHVRYRHIDDRHSRIHHCPHCQYKGVMKWDLKMHMRTHTRKRRRKGKSEVDESTSDSEEERRKKPKVQRKYACHMCPDDSMKTFTRGERLTRHLVNVHGAQWPYGHSRFRYQISEDGMYRLTTTRYEFLDVSEKIVDGSIPKESPQNKLKFKVKEIAEATKTTPKRFAITLKKEKNESESRSESATDDSECEQKMEPIVDKNTVEITMCDVDEEGNIISSKVIDHLYPGLKTE